VNYSGATVFALPAKYPHRYVVRWHTTSQMPIVSHDLRKRDCIITLALYKRTCLFTADNHHSHPELNNKT